MNSSCTNSMPKTLKLKISKAFKMFSIKIGVYLTLPALKTNLHSWLIKISIRLNWCHILIVFLSKPPSSKIYFLRRCIQFFNFEEGQILVCLYIDNTHTNNECSIFINKKVAHVLGWPEYKCNIVSVAIQPPKRQSVNFTGKTKNI